MTSLNRKPSALVALVLVTMACMASVALAQDATPIPTVTGPIPVTADSYPYMAADHLLEPVDLAKSGYVEEEYFIGGTANVYDWAANGDLSVKTPNVPYKTRILLRRPSDPSRFSGNVIVELLHTPYGQDFSPMWGWSHDYLLEHGDAWVGITVVPEGLKALQKFNPTRYPSLSYANPTPDAPCPNAGPEAGAADTEEGLRWDAISQLGALLKSEVPGRPLAGFKVQYLYQTAQDPMQLTYINAIQGHAKLANGKPIYDGYLVKGGGRPVPISRCAAALGPNDPRDKIKNVGVPVIQVQAEGDFPGAFLTRRPDSDEAADRFRLYEIPGVSHFDGAGNRTGFPNLKDMAAAGAKLSNRLMLPGRDVFDYFIVPFRNQGEPRCEPGIVSEQPIFSYLFHGAFMNLDNWVRNGTPPPHAGRLEAQNLGTPQAAVAKDQFGNGLGGVRTPYVDVPVATYHVSQQGRGLCRVFAWDEPFDWSRREALYGNYKNYARKVTRSVDRMVQQHWLTQTDARKVRQELLGGEEPNAAAVAGLR